MSIRRVNKDNLRQDSHVSAVREAGSQAPETGDPLVFWTRHPTHPRQVDLNEFAMGRARGGGRGRSHPGFVPFTGRPELAHQLAPAVQEALAYATAGTAKNMLACFREWWRILDKVESMAADGGQRFARVVDVRLLGPIHAEAAHRSGVSRHFFATFRRIVDITLLALGARETHWSSPEDDTREKHIPPEDQRKALRIAVKRECRKVLEHWELCDELKALSTPPAEPEKAALWMHVHYMLAVQQRTGSALPPSAELNNGKYRQWTAENLGAGLRSLRATAFPDSHDAVSVWTQCLINTPWNPATMLDLDVTQRFLFDHFKDDPNDPHRRWVLIGQKERAGGKDQVLFGMWKTFDGPGYLISKYLARVEPLREILKAQLADAEAEYAQLVNRGEDLEVAGKLFARIFQLKRSCRSVWLFVTAGGEVDSLRDDNRCVSRTIDGRHISYLDELLIYVNARRASRGEKPIPSVSPKNFRVWYADYAYRTSNGSIMAVKVALNHSELRTTIGYINNNILNQEASNAARRFLNILVDELDQGRIDLTILSHLYKYGKFTAEQEQVLADLRSLPKSREAIACKNSYNPPEHLRATPGKSCDVQRCLLCVEHAVLLPESLDGIAMREAELLALQSFVPATVWVEDRYDIELENHKLALRRFDINNVLQARRRWSQAITSGDHLVPGVSSGESGNEIGWYGHS